MKMKTGELGSAEEGAKVMLEGKIIRTKEFDFGLLLIDVDDGSGEGVVAVKKEVLNELGDKKASFGEGKTLLVKGAIDEYKDKKQLVPLDAASLEAR